MPIERASVTPQVVPLGFNPEHLSQIGSIVLNWGGCDVFVGAALENHYRLIGENNPHANRDTKKKLDAIVSLGRKGLINASAECYATSLKEFYAGAKAGRNKIAHGIPSFVGGRLSILTSRGEVIDESGIAEAFEESKYALFIAYHLLQIVVGNFSDPTWPDKP